MLSQFRFYGSEGQLAQVACLFANHSPICTIGSPRFLENAVSTAMRNSIDELSMREVTCWRW